MKKTNWTKGFAVTLTLRVKPDDLKAFQLAAQDDQRTTQDWIRKVLRGEAMHHYNPEDRPPMIR